MRSLICILTSSAVSKRGDTSTSNPRILPANRRRSIEDDLGLLLAIQSINSDINGPQHRNWYRSFREKCHEVSLRVQPHQLLDAALVNRNRSIEQSITGSAASGIVGQKESIWEIHVCSEDIQHYCNARLMNIQHMRTLASN